MVGMSRVYIGVPVIGASMVVGNAYPDVSASIASGFLIGFGVVLIVGLILVVASAFRVPIDTVVVVRDEFGRIVRMLTPGRWHVLRPYFEKAGERFLLHEQMLEIVHEPLVDATGLDMDISVRIGYVVDPRLLDRSVRQRLLDTIGAEPAQWGRLVWGKTLETLFEIIGMASMEQWLTHAQKRALPYLIAQTLRDKLAGLGVQISQVQVLYLAPAAPMRDMYASMKRREMAVQTWAEAVQTLDASGVVENAETVRRLQELALADALAHREGALYVGALPLPYAHRGNGDGLKKNGSSVEIGEVPIEPRLTV